MKDKNLAGESFGYRGNSLIKKAGVKQEFTKEQIQELIRCKNDVNYFVANYCKIITIDKGMQLFKPYDFQKRMFNAFDSSRFIVNLLPRQSGKTTCVAGYLLHYAIFNKEKSIGILANKAAVAREILGRIKRMYENLPLWMQPGVVEWNKGSIELGNDSVMIAASTSSDSVRGFSFSCIYLDEFAFVQNQQDFWDSTYPVITSGEESKIIITSTPKGMEMFHKIYTEAEKGINEFTAVRVDWWEHPARDEKWKKTTIANIGPQRFRQEFGNEFLGSSGTLIDGEKLAVLTHSKPINEKGGLLQYENPIRGREYAIIADVSRGKGQDYSAFSVIDITKMPYNQVCVFRDNMVSPGDYANILYRIGELYNEAMLLVELNDLGEQVADILLMDLGYENLLMTQNDGRNGKRISGGFAPGKVDKGVVTTKSVKSVGCNILKMLIEQDQLIINDHNTIHEFSKFSKKGNSYEAEKGAHDDMVMGLVIFAWLTTQSFFKEVTDSDSIQALRNKTEDEINEDLLPFGYMDDGSEETNIEIDPHNRVIWEM